MLTAYGEDEEINISVPINKIIKEHWKGSTPPDVLTVSTGLGDDPHPIRVSLSAQRTRRLVVSALGFVWSWPKIHQKALVASCMAATMQPRTMVLWQPSETAHVTDMTVHAAFFG